MNVHQVARIALELNELPDEERDEIGRALERIVGLRPAQFFSARLPAY